MRKNSQQNPICKDLKDVARLVARDEDNYAKEMREIKRVSSSPTDAYNSFNAFKRAHGRAGDGLEYHHMTEQSQIGKSGFDIRSVQNGYNMIPLDKATHRKVSGYYGRIVPGTNLSFRNWLAHEGYTYEEQQEIGIYVLEIYGVKVT